LKTTFELGDIGYISKSKSMQENLQVYIDNLNSSKYFNEVTIEQVNGTHVFEVKQCEFAKKNSHMILSEKKHTCPFAIVAAAIIYYSTGENLIIHNTVFNVNGGRTVIEQVKKSNTGK